MVFSPKYRCFYCTFNGKTIRENEQVEFLNGPFLFVSKDIRLMACLTQYAKMAHHNVFGINFAILLLTPFVFFKRKQNIENLKLF